MEYKVDFKREENGVVDDTRALFLSGKAKYCAAAKEEVINIELEK